MDNRLRDYCHMTHVLDAVLDRWISCPRLSLLQLLRAVAGDNAWDDETLVRRLQSCASVLNSENS
jgi:hypothetical protein